MRGADYAELRAFAAVAHHGSFARAALQLGVSPSALSQTLKSLEKRLGIGLLSRTKRSVAPGQAESRLLVRLHHLKGAVDRGELTVFLDERTPAFPGYFFYYPSRQMSPALRAFVNFLLEEV